MFNIGVFAIIIDEDNKILLSHRRDLDLWNRTPFYINLYKDIQICYTKGLFVLLVFKQGASISHNTIHLIKKLSNGVFVAIL